MKNRTLIYFITGSLILLGLLEFLWLQKSYNEQRTDLQQVIQQNLRSVVGQESNVMMMGALRSNSALDSLFRKGLLRLPFSPNFRSDTATRYDSISKITEDKTVKDKHSMRIFIDSTASNRLDLNEIRWTTKQIQPLKGGGRNNIQVILGSDSMTFSTPQIPDSFFKTAVNNNFIYSNWNEDSINLDRISAILSVNFAKNGLPKLPFQLSRVKRGDVVPTERTAIVATARIFDGPHSRTQNKIGIAVYNFEPFLLRKIWSEAAFALFVFGVTSGSFWLVYRNFLKQKQLTALKNAFISNITHELKTPIATVSVALEALQNFGVLDNRALTQEYLEISRNELQRLSMLVDKVLKLAIFDEKEPKLQLESVNLPDLVRHVADSMRLQFEKNGAIFTLNTNENPNLTLEADPTHLTSVVYNLLDNALKYGGKKIEINISLNVKNDQNTEGSSNFGFRRSDVGTSATEIQNRKSDINSAVYLQISDDGKGIAAAFQDKIFDKFFRVPTEDVHDTKGHGLGLSYVAAVIRLHGGSISVESQEGIGTCFNVYLPQKNVFTG